MTLVFPVVLILSGCVTPQPDLPSFPESLLLTDYTTWFAADVEGNRELLRYVLSELDSGLIGVVDRTSRIAGGIRAVPGSPAELSAVVSGAFPKGLVEWVLGGDDSLERDTAQVAGSERVYFRRAEGTLQLALPADDYLYVSTGRVLEMLRDRPPAELEIDPSVYRSLRRVGRVGQTDALLVFHEPGSGFLRSLGVDARGLPIARIELSITNRVAADSGTGEADGGTPDTPAEAIGAPLELGGVIELRSEQSAALFGRLGRLFVLVFVRALGLESAAVQEQAVITVDGSRVIFAQIPMQREELVTAIRRITGAEQEVQP
ncbi:MAG: hypothetical protein ACOCY8_02825 [Spirochaetota bacterium]